MPLTLTPPDRSRIRFGVATISFPDTGPDALIQAVAASGLQGIEWRLQPAEGASPAPPGHPFLAGRHAGTMPHDPAAARRIGDATRAAGLELIGLGAYADTDDVASLERAFAAAEAAGAPRIRLQAPRPGVTGRRYDELIEPFRRFFDVAEARGRARGIGVLLEIHHRTIAPSVELALRVIADRDPEVVGAIYDVGNLVWEGYVDHEIALDRLGPYLQHVHLKNATIIRRPGGGWEPAWTPLEDGAVDVSSFLRGLQRRGYAGWISLEELSQDRPPLDALRHNVAQLRRWDLLNSA